MELVSHPTMFFVPLHRDDRDQLAAALAELPHLEDLFPVALQGRIQLQVGRLSGSVRPCLAPPKREETRQRPHIRLQAFVCDGALAEVGEARERRGPGGHDPGPLCRARGPGQVESVARLGRATSRNAPAPDCLCRSLERVTGRPDQVRLYRLGGLCGMHGTNHDRRRRANARAASYRRQAAQPRSVPAK